ncbi:MAG: RAMP superfamily CRISPR-associated protein [Limisphaerales bacterium]
MNIQTVSFRFKLLTPCFSGTAMGKHGGAEMRVPPIRGHIRFWHRVLYSAESCNEVWGSASGETGNASKVAVRLFNDGTISEKKFSILPHKDKGKGTGNAIPRGEEFEFELQRLVGCSDDNWRKAQNATKLWLLLGSLGLRSNRAAGSVWPVENWTPKNKDELTNQINQLGLKAYSIALIGKKSNNDSETLRETASDTIRNRAHSNIFGSISPRKPSPTKFKVIELEDGLYLLALAPKKTEQRLILEEAERLLNMKPDPARWRGLGKWNYIIR